jgi:signal transduction histidine kinase
MKIELNNVRETNELLNMVLENINSAIFLVDDKNCVVSVNNSGSILFSKPAEKMIGELCGNAIGCINPYYYKLDCGTTPKCKNCSIRQSIRASVDEFKPTTRVILKRTFVLNDIEIPKIFIYSTRLITVAGLNYVIVIIDDITEAEKQHEMLINLGEEKNRFIGIAAHDIRNPLSIIQMYAKTYLDFYQKNLTEQQLGFLETIIKKSDYAIKLLEDLLDISKIESGIQLLQITEVEFISFIDNIIANHQLLAKKKDMTITFTCSIPKTILSIDVIKIERAVSNLILNAIKYSNRGSSILVRLSRENKFLKTEVIDEGIGIPLEKQGDLFKPFTALISEGTEGEKSIGLGLNIVKKIVEVHNGSVGVLSDPGKGSNFYFLLPLSKENVANGI